MAHEATDNETRVADEVDALRAIYGADNVSYLARTGAFSVDLGDRVGVLSMILPPGYPGTARPSAPTLRAGCLSATTSAQIVNNALSELIDYDLGAECIFEYCQAVIQAVDNTAASGSQNNALHLDEKPTEQGSGQDMSTDTVDLVDFTQVSHGKPLVDKKSAFQAHLAYISNVSQVAGFLQYLQSYGKVSSAAHNIMAYRVGAAQDFDDDGEHGAGRGLLFILQQMNFDNIVVVVSRWFGGIKLGPVRFKHVNNVARTLLTEQSRLNIESSHPGSPVPSTRKIAR
jgi:hypothetical protein